MNVEGDQKPSGEGFELIWHISNHNDQCGDKHGSLKVRAALRNSRGPGLQFCEGQNLCQAERDRKHVLTNPATGSDSAEHWRRRKWPQLVF